MSNFITLEDFNRGSAQYYVYRRNNSSVSHMPHYHDYFQLCYLVSGQILHSQGEDSTVLQGGEAFIIPPGFVHKVRFTDDSSNLYTLAFHESFLQTDLAFLKDLQSLQKLDTIHLRLCPNAEQNRSIHTLFDCLLREQNTKCPEELSAAPFLIGAIINILAQCYYNNPKHQRQPWRSGDNLQLLRRCIAYIDTHFTEQLNADALAKQFGLSRSALSSAFPQYTGFPMHKYITQKRIQKAQALIRSQPKLSLGDIAAMVGYEDTSTFYRNFLKISGIAPAQYRDQYLSKKD